HRQAEGRPGAGSAVAAAKRQAAVAVAPAVQAGTIGPPLPPRGTIGVGRLRFPWREQCASKDRSSPACSPRRRPLAPSILIRTRRTTAATTIEAATTTPVATTTRIATTDTRRPPTSIPDGCSH